MVKHFNQKEFKLMYLPLENTCFVHNFWNERIEIICTHSTFIQTFIRSEVNRFENACLMNSFDQQIYREDICLQTLLLL